MNKIKLMLTALLIALSGAAAGICGDRPAAVLPILMYHHIVADDAVGDAVISVGRFEEQLRYLFDSGWETVSFDEVIAFADGRGDLPDKPVCIVFDDGYESNYSLAFPLLEKYGMKATICVIGSAVGCSGEDMLPHFGWDEAREMVSSGLISIQNHTYDMHMSAPSGSVFRPDALPLASESESDYAAALGNDYRRCAGLIRRELGYEPVVFAYPHGRYNELSERILRTLGARVTLTTEPGVNLIIAGDRDTLYTLKRYNINDGTEMDSLVDYLAGDFHD